MFGPKRRIAPPQKSKPKPVQKPSGTSRIKASLLSLESRLMFDAAAATTEVEVNQEQVAQEQAEAAVSSDRTLVSVSQASVESQGLLQAIASYSPGETPTEIAFVDPTVPDYQALIAGMGSNVQIVMLDGGQDGMERIAASLTGRTGIDAIHIISHGAEGQLSLGTGTLTQASMTGRYADELANIKQALSEQADILVYGCDFAEGQAGQDAATLLSQLTGADVAASVDDTGYAGLGGDWDLELQTGTIETQIVVSNDTQVDWVGLLAGETPPTITSLSGDSRAYSEGAEAVVIESGNAVVADVDSTNFDTGTLTVSFTAGSDSAEDVLAIRNQGTGAGQIGVSGANVTYQGVTIGTFTGGSSGSNLVITLNASATSTAVTALVRNITYQNTDTHAPTTGARTVRFVLTDGDGGTSPNYNATVTVSAVNDAPVLADTALTLTVAEDAGGPSGVVGAPISAFTGGISDVDTGTSKGLAITGSNATNGTWYYTRNGGTTWTAVGTVSNTSALLLADNVSTRLYFAPRANYNGASLAALTVRAWDQTSGTAGTKVSTATNGGTTAFSSATDTVDVTVTAVNDAPTITSLSGDSRAYSEGAEAVVIESGNAVVADVDSTNFDTGTLTVSFTAGSDSAEDVLAIRNQGTGAGQIGVSGANVTYQGVTIGTFTGGSSGSNLVITLNASATSTAVTALVRNITYQNTDTHAPTTGARTVRFVLTDGDGGTSPNYNATVTVSAVNDAPVLADTALTLTVAEDAGGPSGVVGAPISAFTGGISDVDTGTSKGLAITGSNATNGTWYYTRNGGTTWTAVGTVSNTSALLLADNVSTRLYFAPRANYNGTSLAALTVRAWDQTSGTAGTKVSTATNGGTTAFSSATDTVDVTVTAVNDAPTITSLSGDSRAYSEGAEAVVIESGNAVVADVDSTNFDTGTLTVSFTAGSDSAEDVLAIRNQGTGAGQIGVSGANVTYQGVTIGTFTGGSSGSNLVITLNASATSTAVTALVRNITYQNTDTHAPTTGARTVRFVLTDGDGGTSPNYNATVTVSAVNDAPVLADTALTLTVAEDAGVPSGVVGAPISAFTGGISDVDTGTSKGLAITGSNATNGTWYYTRNGGTTWTAVGTVSNTSALLLADNVSTRLYFAPRANYNGASLAALTVRAWDQTSGTAGTKVSTATNGGTTAFSSATDTVDVTVTAVNDAPTITSLSGDSRAYSEGAEAVVIESGNAVVADVDSTNFDTGTLTVSFTAGSDSAEDVLAIRNQGTGAGQIGVSGANVTYQGVTIGTFTGGSRGSALVITLNASATSTAMTALVRNITYQNTDTHAPTTGARTVRFVLTDGDGGTSPNYNATVTVSAVNDAPVLADTALTLTVAEDAGVPSGVVGAPISAFTGGISDVDTGASKGLAITGSNATNGTWYYTRNGGTTWTAVGTVSNTSALLLADNVSTRLYFAPRANYNGASLAALTVRAWDQTSGTAGTKVSTATNGGTTAFSSATDTVDVTVTAVNDAPTGVPLITGTVTEDQTLTADTSGLGDADGLGTFRYQWLRNGVAIGGATGSTYTLGDADVGTQISVAVSYTDGQGTSESVTSVPTAPVLNVNDAPTGVPLITGTVTEDQTLTADTSGLGDADGLGTFRYQWLRNGVAIGGATGSTYTLGDADVGTEISVTVSYTDGQGTSESVRSVPTAPVLNVNDAPLLVTNSGSTVAEGGTDTIDVSELAVTDADHAEAQLTYSIGIGPAHGRLEFITAPGISTSSFTQADILANRLVYVHDGSETTSDSFTFTVGDGAGGTLGTTTMTLTIIPVNDAPVITSDGGASMAIVTVAEHVSAVTIVTGADVDLAAQTLTYHISGGVDQALFTINMTTGALSFVAPPNFEVATDANGDNVYVVEVQVIDSQGASTTQTIQVTVTDIAEPLPPNLATLSIPPILLSPTASSPAGPTLVSSTPSSSAEPSPDVLPQSLAPQGSSTTPVELDSTPIVQLPLDSRTAQSDARFPGERGKPMDLAKDQPLFTVRQGGPDPVQDLGPSEVSRPMSELPPATLDEMAVSLEHLAGESEERHPLSTRIVALAGTTLSVAFIAWALHRGALLAGPLWKTSWPGGTPRRKQ